ncbi:MAG TPA: hypothetical protein VEV16_02365 [Daejeonella sp.]|nr:hypothetical protein [Daejeonella sp.]
MLIITNPKNHSSDIRVRDSSGKPAAHEDTSGEDLQRIARPVGARPNKLIDVMDLIHDYPKIMLII